MPEVNFLVKKGLTVPKGSASTPAVIFDASDSNTGLYSPGADQVAISTNSSGRLFIDANGNVGINTASTIAPGGFGYAREFALTGATSGDSSTSVNLRGSRTVSGGFADINFWHQSTANRAYIQARRGSSDSAIDLDFITSGGAGMRITSAGLVGIGSTTALGYKLNIYESGTGMMNALHLGSGGGTAGNGASISFGLGTGFDPTANILAKIGGIYTGAGYEGALTFHTNPDSDGASPRERARIDSSGRLLIGTSSTSANTTALFQGYNGIATGPGHVRIATGTNSPANDANLGLVLFSDSEHTNCAFISANRDGGTWSGSSKPTRLGFSTTADGASSPTERMRIGQDGGTYWRSNAATATHDLGNLNTSITGEVIIASAYRNTVNDTFRFFTCIRQGFAVALEIRDDGDVYNVNGTYGSLSDAKLKENIVDAQSQWDDIKQLRVRNYNFKPETNNSTHKQIGVIAQEIENVSPGLVNTVSDRDADGNDLGTVTKSVNYSVLYMKAIKALQEAMERIEALEGHLEKFSLYPGRPPRPTAAPGVGGAKTRSAPILRDALKPM